MLSFCSPCCIYCCPPTWGVCCAPVPSDHSCHQFQNFQGNFHLSLSLSLSLSHTHTHTHTHNTTHLEHGHHGTYWQSCPTRRVGCEQEHRWSYLLGICFSASMCYSSTSYDSVFMSLRLPGHLNSNLIVGCQRIFLYSCWVLGSGWQLECLVCLVCLLVYLLFISLTRCFWIFSYIFTWQKECYFLSCTKIILPAWDVHHFNFMSFLTLSTCIRKTLSEEKGHIEMLQATHTHTHTHTHTCTHTRTHTVTHTHCNTHTYMYMYFSKQWYFPFNRICHHSSSVWRHHCSLEYQ